MLWKFPPHQLVCLYVFNRAGTATFYTQCQDSVHGVGRPHIIFTLRTQTCCIMSCPHTGIIQSKKVWFHPEMSIFPLLRCQNSIKGHITWIKQQAEKIWRGLYMKLIEAGGLQIDTKTLTEENSKCFVCNGVCFLGAASTRTNTP